MAVRDGKPLPGGGLSKDRDAAYGRAAGHVATGYQLHAVWGQRPVPETWEVTSLKVGAKEVAQRLLPQRHHGGYLLADGNYDASYRCDAAWARGYQLVQPLPARKHPGRGQHYQSPHRLRSRTLQRRPQLGRRAPFGEEWYQLRSGIERSFGTASTFAGGLQPLPAWVRGLPRVRSWVWAKLLINGVRIRRNKDTPRLKNVESLGTRSSPRGNRRWLP